MLKYLRIAVTVLSLTACLLLIALWVRSYSWEDRLILRYALSVDLQSRGGQQLISFYSQPWEIYNIPQPDTRRIWNWRLSSRPAQKRDFPATYFRWYGGESGLEADVPHWCLVLVSGAVAAVPWRTNSPRFSLRTLLIATTLVAVALGIIVAAR